MFGTGDPIVASHNRHISYEAVLLLGLMNDVPTLQKLR